MSDPRDAALRRTLPATPAGTVALEQYVVDDRDWTRWRVPYRGADAGVRAAFPEGFPIGFGSGLALKARHADDHLEFWFVTDRGPNGDAPDYRDAAIAAAPAKTFPVPDYHPSYGVLTLRHGALRPSAMQPLIGANGRPVTGLPRPEQALGATHEVALSEALQPLSPRHDPQGLDPEGIAAAGDTLWLCDEYGPFLLRVDAASGRIDAQLAPGRGLPEILQRRQPNRGFEAIAVTPAGRVYAGMQSTLQMPAARDAAGRQRKATRAAPFIRLLEHDPASGRQRMFAYPHEAALFDQGDAKLGDLSAIDEHRFLLLEQGRLRSDGRVHNLVYLIDLEDASDLSDILVDGLAPEYLPDLDALRAAGIRPLRKTLLLDLKAPGVDWLPEKAEGLAVIDDRSFAVSSDNDFGVEAQLLDHSTHPPRVLEPGACEYDGARGAYAGKACGGGPFRYQLGRQRPEHCATHLWLFRLPQPFADYRCE